MCRTWNGPLLSCLWLSFKHVFIHSASTPPPPGLILLLTARSNSGNELPPAGFLFWLLALQFSYSNWWLSKYELCDRDIFSSTTTKKTFQKHCFNISFWCPHLGDKEQIFSLPQNSFLSINPVTQYRGETGIIGLFSTQSFQNEMHLRKMRTKKHILSNYALILKHVISYRQMYACLT